MTWKPGDLVRPARSACADSHLIYGERPFAEFRNEICEVINVEYSGFNTVYIVWVLKYKVELCFHASALVDANANVNTYK